VSSAEFEAEIATDPRLRALVLCFGAVAAIVGAWLIAGLALEFRWRAGLAAGWLLDCGFVLRRQWLGMRDVRALRLTADGTACVISANGAREPSALLGGSVLIGRFAWLRIERACGRRYGELVGAGRCGTVAWHRFRLVWRQTAHIIGHTDRA
jgi:hypothetical protein